MICMALKKKKVTKAKMTPYIILQFVMFLALMVLESVLKCNEV